MWQCANCYLPITIYTTMLYNRAATDITVDVVEFSDINAAYVFTFKATSQSANHSISIAGCRQIKVP